MKNTGTLLKKTVLDYPIILFVLLAILFGVLFVPHLFLHIISKIFACSFVICW